MSNFFNIESVNKKVSKKEIMEKLRKERDAIYISQSEVLKRKIFTQKEVDDYILEKKLTRVEYSGKIYFRRDVVFSLIKNT